MKKNHDHIMKHIPDEQMWDYISDNAKVIEKEEIEKHLDECHQCRNGLELMMLMHKDLYNQEHEHVSMGFANAVITKLEEEQKVERASLFWIHFTKYVIVGSLLLAVGALLMVAGSQNMDVSITIKFEEIMTLLVGCGLMWGLYVTDRIFYMTLRKK